MDFLEKVFNDCVEQVKIKIYSKEVSCNEITLIFLVKQDTQKSVKP